MQVQKNAFEPVPSRKDRRTIKFILQFKSMPSGYCMVANECPRLKSYEEKFGLFRVASWSLQPRLIDCSWPLLYWPLRLGTKRPLEVADLVWRCLMTLKYLTVLAKKYLPSMSLPCLKVVERCAWKRNWRKHNPQPFVESFTVSRYSSSSLL